MGSSTRRGIVVRGRCWPYSAHVVERLERRRLLAVANGIWTGAGDGINWTSAANWSNNVIPGPGDDVVINVTANPTVIVSGTQSVKSLTSSETIVISGSLNVAGAGLVKLSVLAFGTGGKLDINANDILLTGTSRATVEGYVRTAYNGGAWNGASGIFSTTAKNNAQVTTTLGVLSGADYKLLNGPTFDGQSVANTDALVKYTYYGDVNFDGFTDGLDYIFIDNGFLSHSTGWANGDVNYDGFVDGLDYIFIDNAFLSHGPGL